MKYYDEDRAVTLEDLHGQVFEEEQEFCQLSCEVWGYHRYPCVHRTVEDERYEVNEEQNLAIALGK